MARPTNLTMCSFCGKSHSEVKKLIAGPGVYICDNCIGVCSEIIEKELSAEMETASHALDFERAAIYRDRLAALSAIQSILEQEGLAWTDVVKVTKYVTDMRDMDGMVAVLKQTFGDWTPASTTVCVNQLSTPGARIELDMIAAYRRS